MQRANLKSVISSTNKNKNTKNIMTNSNYDLTSTISLNSKVTDKNKKQLELKTKYEKNEKMFDSHPFNNTISNSITPNFIKKKDEVSSSLSKFKEEKENQMKPSSFKTRHKKNISEIPPSYVNSHMDMVVEYKESNFSKYRENIEKLNIDPQMVLI